MTSISKAYQPVLVYSVLSIIFPIVSLLYGHKPNFGYLYYLILAFIMPVMGSFICSFINLKGNYNYNYNYKYYSNTYFLFFSSLIMFLLLYRIISFATSLGVVGSIFDVARVLTINRYSDSIENFDVFTQLLMFYNYPIIIYLQFTTSVTFISKFFRYLIYFFVLLIPVLVGSKAMVVFLFIIVFFKYLDLDKSLSNKLINFIFLFLLLFSFVLFVHLNRTNDAPITDIFNKIFISYLIAPFILFTEWISNSCNVECLFPQNFGSNTFLGISKYIFPVNSTRSEVGFFILNGGVFSSNVYTAYRWIILDFGIILSSIIMFFIGFFLTLFYRLFLLRRNNIYLPFVLIFFLFLYFSFFGSIYKYLTNYSFILVLLFFFISYRVKNIES